MTAEHARLAEIREKKVPWRKWGPYLSERQWGTVREDYSDSGDAWNYFSHDQARSRAYRWGEDGLGGISDDEQRLCFAFALWNGKDPILKERLFGLTNSESNHGEDVKEYYFYLDSTPTHSYMKFLYKYPQAPFPYSRLVETSRRLTRHDLEYELMDTGVFDTDRYFDVFVEYAKASPEDLLIEFTVHNRGPEPAELHLLPTLWFQNSWSRQPGDPARPAIAAIASAGGYRVAEATHAELGTRYFYSEGASPLVFTDNETNRERIFGEPQLQLRTAACSAAIGNDFTVECPTGSGRFMNLYEVAAEITRRLTCIFLRDGDGRRPVYGGTSKFQEDPHWRDLVLFYEYFHGDNGAGIGASHQTGWTGCIARLMHMFATSTADQMLELGQMAAAVETASPCPDQLEAAAAKEPSGAQTAGV